MGLDRGRAATGRMSSASLRHDSSLNAPNHWRPRAKFPDQYIQIQYAGVAAVTAGPGAGVLQNRIAIAAIGHEAVDDDPIGAVRLHRDPVHGQRRDLAPWS